MTHEIKITKQYLKVNRDHIFIFGDNEKRCGLGGAAKLRDMPNTYGFITKKAPGRKVEDYYTVKEYQKIFHRERAKLLHEMRTNPDKTYLLSMIGAGLANKHGIFEEVILPQIKYYFPYMPNLIFLWNHYTGGK